MLTYQGDVPEVGYAVERIAEGCGAAGTLQSHI